MAPPNAIEVGLIIEFRKRFKSDELNEDQSTDMFLVRWIRARDQNLDKAEEMLRMYLKRRLTKDLDNISSWEPPQEFKSLVFLGIIGDDEENSPVILQKFGKNKLHKIVQTGQQETFVRYIDLIWDQLHNQMKSKTLSDGVTPVTQFVCIADMNGFAYKSVANKGVMDLLIQFSRAFEANQPETLKKLYFINAGRVFPLLYSILKPILGPATKSKISVYGSPSKWKPILLKNLPARILPPAYGGTNTTSFFGANISVAEAEAETDESDDKRRDFLKITLPSADILVVGFEVAHKNNTLYWAFKTDQNPIGFVVRREGRIVSNTDTETKVDSHLKLVEGMLTCDVPGDYMLTFDNTANDKAQEVKYCVDVRSPSGVKQLTFD